MFVQQSIQHLIGVKFRQLTLIKDLGVKNSQRMGLVLCDCGAKKEIRVSELKCGKTKSCGCRLRQAGLERQEDVSKLIGVKFNRLTVIENSGRVKGVLFCVFKCDCGTIKKIKLSDVKCGYTKSCGCLVVELNKIGDKGRTHGLTAHPLHSAWADMKARCYNKNATYHKGYGGSGVKVCPEWKRDFMAFYVWAMANGWKEGLELDKDILYRKKHGTKTGLLYSPEYCQFVTHKENMRHRSNTVYLEYNNETKSLSEWIELLNLNSKRVRERIRKGWGIKKAFEIPHRLTLSNQPLNI